MNKSAEFVAPNPEIAMRKFTAGLRRAVKIPPAKLEERVLRDNLQREARRAESGQAKRGPKPRA